MWVAGVDDGAGGVEAGGANPRSISTCTSCCRISPESVGLVLDMGADTGVEWLHSSMGCISMVLTSCGRYWNGLGERAGESGMCTKVLVSMGVGAVGGLVGWGGNWLGGSGSSVTTVSPGYGNGPRESQTWPSC